MTPRRSGDLADSHAHKRIDDEFARLHARMDDSDKLINELMRVRFEMLEAQRELSDGMAKLTEAVTALTEQTAATRALEGDVMGTMRVLERVSNFVGVLWND